MIIDGQIQDSNDFQHNSNNQSHWDHLFLSLKFDIDITWPWPLCCILCLLMILWLTDEICRRSFWVFCLFSLFFLMWISVDYVYYMKCSCHNNIYLFYAGHKVTLKHISYIFQLLQSELDLMVLILSCKVAAGGSGRLPYQALANQTLDIEVQGLPTDRTLRKPSFYGCKQLEMILKAADQILFKISKFASGNYKE